MPTFSLQIVLYGTLAEITAPRAKEIAAIGTATDNALYRRNDANTAWVKLTSGAPYVQTDLVQFAILNGAYHLGLNDAPLVLAAVQSAGEYRIPVPAELAGRAVVKNFLYTPNPSGNFNEEALGAVWASLVTSDGVTYLRFQTGTGVAPVLTGGSIGTINVPIYTRAA